MYKGDFIQEYIQEHLDEKMKEAIQKGREEGKIDLIENELKKEIMNVDYAIEELITLKCETKKISQITGLTEKEIQNSYINEQNNNQNFKN
ncbi:MAG: hypothetical protein E7Z74_04845 [Methanobrevibacter millerae]|uniref:Uncharacterized protein n=1 Tax=Methanobrevibacter millerae TaxID=230361 RepID=A0A8T3VRJ6_9EURY|nr:hypothetical protein [Methanobrevibacter millerae]